MGRDKPKKYSKMGYFEKEQWKKDEAKKRGIAGETYTDYRGNTQTRVNEKALKESIRNDYDYRTSASHMDGAKGNGKFNDFTNYERAAVKLHKKAGNGGQYSSTEDITTVTNNLVKDYRRGIQDQIDANKNQTSSVDPDNRSILEDFDGPIEFEHSDKVKDAKSRIDKYTLSLGKENLFGKVNDSVPAKDDQAAAADSFVNDYRKDVSTAANLKENKAQNINNAIDTARSIYRPQFM